MQGKKQVDIREDNKSAVIDILLKRSATLLHMSEQLKLSHTALAKVIKELMQKNVVCIAEGEQECETCALGRPPKIYGINGDCAIACAVVLTRERIFIYYFDMRGFQINECVCENTFPTVHELLSFVTSRMTELKVHPRLRERILKYIYVGIPSYDFYGAPFCDLHDTVYGSISAAFPEIGVVVRRNIDYEMIAETKYGGLKDGGKNAVMLNFDSGVCASLLLGGTVYDGDTHMQGLMRNSDFRGLSGVLGSGEQAERFCRAYESGDAVAVSAVSDALCAPLSFLASVLSFLDVSKVIIGGESKHLGDSFLSYVSRALNAQASFSEMGRDVPPALAGAVWLSTYTTLQEVMSR